LQHYYVSDCLHTDTGEKPAIERVCLEAGEIRASHSRENKLVFIVEGEIRLSFACYNRYVIDRQQAVYLPVGYDFRIEAGAAPVMLLVLRLFEPIRFCACLHMEDLKDYTGGGRPRSRSLYLLEVRPSLKLFIEALEGHLDKGMKCRLYFRHKVREVFFLLKAGYSPQELAGFFYLARSADQTFSNRVLKVCDGIRDTRGLASAMHMSLRGLEKKFRQVYGEPPKVWIAKRRAEALYNALVMDDKPLKALACDMGFSSVSGLAMFSQRWLKATPREIRYYGRKKPK
jgi:hypothetical protein